MNYSRSTIKVQKPGQAFFWYCVFSHSISSPLLRSLNGTGKYHFLSAFNPFTPKSDLIDLTLSNARRFYSSKGDPLGVKGLKNYLP